MCKEIAICFCAVCVHVAPVGEQSGTRCSHNVSTYCSTLERSNAKGTCTWEWSVTNFVVDMGNMF